MRASVAAEKAGIPSVSLVCSGFERQALATGRGLGIDNLPLAVLNGHVDSVTSEEMISRFLAQTVPEILRGLTVESLESDAQHGEPSALDIVGCGSIDHINDLFARKGWSDGSPIVPPTKDRVDDFIAESGNDPWRVIGQARPSSRDMTVWSVAVNAVMAGVRAEHFPVLLAIAEVLADPTYGVEHSGNTTGADALIVVSGPSTAELGFNSGAGALRDGTPANTTIGRWLRLYQRNVCGFTISEHDKATFGNSARVVLAEDHETLREIRDHGWFPLSADFGFDANDDTVTIVRVNGGTIVGSVFGSTAEQIIAYLADGLARLSGWELTHNYGLGSGQFQPLLVVSPLLARTFVRSGWSKDDVRSALFEQARIPAWRYESYIGIWSNLTTGQPTLTELAAAGHVPEAFAVSTDPNRLVPIVFEPSKFRIAVAGDPNRANAYVMSNDGPHGMWTSKRIDRSRSDDLVCRVE